MVDLELFFASIESRHCQDSEKKKWIKDAKDNIRNLSDSLRLIDLVTRSWNQFDPGRYEPYVFFVRDYLLRRGDGAANAVAWCDAFFPREIICGLEQAEFGVSDYRYGSDNHIKPVPLGRISEACKIVCPRCRSSAFVMGEHRQSHDTPHGDVWELSLYSLCPYCSLVRKFALTTSGYRLTLFLESPAGQ